MGQEAGAAVRVRVRALTKATRALFFVFLLGLFYGLFDDHVVELFGVKDFAALETLDELGVLMPGDDAHSGGFAGACHHGRDSDEVMMLFPPIVAAFFPNSSDKMRSKCGETVPSAPVCPAFVPFHPCPTGLVAAMKTDVY